MNPGLRLGANYLGEGRCSFLLWAPMAAQVHVRVVAPQPRELPMRRADRGYWHLIADEVEPGTRYLFRIDGKMERPDPASRFQPDGVHQASAVIATEFPWEDEAWFGCPLHDYILYELHVGTFTEEGTFDAIIPHLRELRELGVTALELMPVAQFPGPRNWGYDGVNLFAVQNSYGGPEGLKRLVNASHRAGLAVVLDVVYNHLGPEGNYLRDFGPYFNDSDKTLWGSALNFDGPHSDEVRRFFLENALYWQRDFHMDALRLDAVHAIRDFSAIPFLQELARTTHAEAERLNRRFHLIAESDLNNARYILPEALGGYGLDAQWSDDFHHCLHVLLTGEQTGYYEDFGGTRLLAKVFREGYAYTGEYSRHRQRRHGSPPKFAAPEQFVVYAQNHDQVGNRLRGDRLSRLTSFEALKLGATTVLLSPFTPMLFMGEEYGEPAPFQYVTSHSDPQLVEAVREGRRQEFAHFQGASSAPDPQAETTFLENKLNRGLPERDEQSQLLRKFYREVIRQRRELSVISRATQSRIEANSLERPPAVWLRYWNEDDEVVAILCFATEPSVITLELPPGSWRKTLDSAGRRWGGPGSRLPPEIEGGGKAELSFQPQSAVVFARAPREWK